ncbi:hypothetical protein N665_0528s0034 [Sinapis alba]|nr:hypothetical protein N665_0528s0034 [Sinapis alba]
MTKKVKLALMANENSRAVTLKRRSSGLVKKVKELSILCDVKACLIMFSPKEIEPMVWPSAEAARNLLKDFNDLPDFMKKKNETTLESYLKEKIHENLRKTQKENMECKIDQLMVQLSSFPKLDDLDVKEIYSLISSTKDAIMHLRNKVGYVQNFPLRDPPVYPFEEQFKEFRTTTGGGQEKERARKTYEEVNMASIGSSKEKQNYCLCLYAFGFMDLYCLVIFNNHDDSECRNTRMIYLMDEWIFPSLKSPSSQTDQKIMMKMESYNNNTLDPRCYQSYQPYQGSNSNGYHKLEMEPTFPPMLAFPGFVGSHEEQSSIHKSSDIDDRQEPPPSASEETAEEGNVGAKVI